MELIKQIVSLLVLALAASSLAMAHMPDRRDLDTWFNGLVSSGGYPCCSSIDGSTLADVDWDTTIVDGKHHYRVRVEGQWIVVTDAEVVNGPNKYGRPLVWIYHSENKPVIRCFMPGAGG